MTTPFFAAVDLGSNAFRLMIGHRASIGVSHVIKEVASFREPVRLSHGLHGSTLDDSSLERGWRALERFGKRLQGFEPSRVRAVATNTVRVASNATVFLAKAGVIVLSVQNLAVRNELPLQIKALGNHQVHLLAAFRCKIWRLPCRQTQPESPWTMQKGALKVCAP
ncbi:hypothetical protein E0W60_31440 (plasmid) [Cupriavidus oxalaticus]|uniref:Ppx/GppA phosphatase N-terminal domain-containing protein n=1 Tax=Cupriavidus oxalaticus TaxID=96344 RepID=A0A4P7LS56_9BURK|nr:hypothetical protein E0W60_31440 [Cupriavidus oxalaticus]